MFRFNEREYGLTIPAVAALTGISAFKHSTDQTCQSFIIHHTTSTDSASLYCLMQFYTAVWLHVKLHLVLPQAGTQSLRRISVGF